MLVRMGPSHESRHLLDARDKYRILIRGTVDASWLDRLGGMTVSTTRLADGSAATILSGELVDQSALVGVVNTLHDLGIPLISVERVAAESNNR
jgi:hypothetical protein